MGVKPTVQPMHTCGCQPLINAYLYQLYLWNHWVALHLLVSNLKCSLLLLGLLTESLDHTRLMGAPPKVQLMLVSSTYRITKLHYTYMNATLSKDYVGYLYFQNHFVKPHIWVCNLKRSLCWLALRRESLECTTLMGKPP